MEKKKIPRQKNLNFMKRRQVDRLCSEFVNWLLDNHYEVIAPLLNKWKEEKL